MIVLHHACVFSDLFLYCTILNIFGDSCMYVLHITVLRTFEGVAELNAARNILL